MMKRLTALLLGAIFVLTLLPAAAMAAPSVSIKMRNVEITDGNNVTYYLNDGLGGVTADNADENNNNVKYDPSTQTLTLNNAYILGKRNSSNNHSDAVKTEGDVKIVLEGMNTLQGGSPVQTMGTETAAAYISIRAALQ